VTRVSRFFAEAGLIVGAVDLHVLVVGNRIDETEDVFAAIGIEAIKKDGRSAARSSRANSSSGFADDDFAIIVYAKFPVPTCKTIFISSLAAMAPSHLRDC